MDIYQGAGMPLKHSQRPHHTGKTPRTGTASRRKKGIVDAVIFREKSDLSLYLSMQNLLNFFVESINTYISATQAQLLQADYITRCATSIRKLYSINTAHLPKDLNQIFAEFLEEAENFSDLAQTLSATDQNLRSISRTTLAQIIGKVSHLQWLSVCIMQELKHAFTHT